MTASTENPRRPRVAVLLAGHIRSFARCFPTQCDHLRAYYEHADFFVSTVKDADTPSVDIIVQRYPQARVYLHTVPAQPELPIPVAPTVEDWTIGRLYGHEPYAISVHPQAILRQLWQLNECWQFATSVVTAELKEVDGFQRTYDLIIRQRPDNYFRVFRRPLQHFAPSLGCDVEVHSHQALTPCWGRFGGINDRFAILGSAAAGAYFTTYQRLSDLLASGYPLHPERLIWASLTEAGCTIDDTLQAWFSKLIWDHGKDHGSFRDPEVTHVDVAHWAFSR